MGDPYGNDQNYENYDYSGAAYGGPVENPGEASNKRPRVEGGGEEIHMDVTTLSKMMQIFDKDQLLKMAMDA